MACRDTTPARGTTPRQQPSTAGFGIIPTSLIFDSRPPHPGPLPGGERERSRDRCNGVSSPRRGEGQGEGGFTVKTLGCWYWSYTPSFFSRCHAPRRSCSVFSLIFQANKLPAEGDYYDPSNFFCIRRAGGIAYGSRSGGSGRCCVRCNSSTDWNRSGRGSRNRGPSEAGARGGSSQKGARHAWGWGNG